MRLLPVAVATAAVLTVAACGTPQSGAAAPATPVAGSSAPASSGPSSAPPARPTGIAPGEPAPTGSKGPGGNVPGVIMVVPATQVDTTALSNFGKDPQVTVGDGGRTLRITTGKATGCATMKGMLRQQTAAGVWIALVPLATPQGGEKCAESMNKHPVVVRLDAPLDKRTVHLTSSR